jgi:hypothetical protein
MTSSRAKAGGSATPRVPGRGPRAVRRFLAVTTTPAREGGYVVAGFRVASKRSRAEWGGRGRTKGSARLTAVTTDRPVDAVIMATVDSFDIDARVTKLG